MLCYNKIRNSEDGEEAFKRYIKSAEEGDTIAQYILGNCYQNGDIWSTTKNSSDCWV